jgi:hypothetical protein
MQTIQRLTRQILELDYGITELETEALHLSLPQYFVSQREVDHLFKMQRALQNEWNNAMSEFALCRSAHHAYPLLAGEG